MGVVRKLLFEELSHFVEPFLHLLDDKVDQKRKGSPIEVTKKSSKLLVSALQSHIHLSGTPTHHTVIEVIIMVMQFFVKQTGDDHSHNKNKRTEKDVGIDKH
jgi:hypothetical protein